MQFLCSFFILFFCFIKAKDYQERYNELQSEIEILREQKSTIHIKVKEERSRADILERDRKSLRQTVESLNDKEVSSFNTYVI